jgi:putative ABC transport system permease protein
MPVGSDCVSPPAGPRFSIATSAVDPSYFNTMGIAVISGREFTSEDLPKGSAAVIVNETLARRAWPGSQGLGERLTVGCDTARAAVVVGIVRDAAIRNLGERPQPQLYRPFARQYSGGLTTILLDTTIDPEGMIPAVRRTLAELGQGIRVYTIRPLSIHVSESYAGVRWLATILSGFGLLALVLATIGLYAVIAYRVSGRTQEIGVRMALGATRPAIFREVVWQGLAIVLVAVVIGEGLAIPVTRAVGSLQEGIRPVSVTTHVVVDVIWIVVALLACYAPAARAARVDPLVALRYE